MEFTADKPPSIEKPGEVLGQQFALRFWKMQVRLSFSAWFSNKARPRVERSLI
jgi:hypothetical protein